MKINLEVTSLDSVTTKVTAQFADFIAFENEKNRSVANFQTELRLTDLAWLAWHAEKRTKKTAMKFEEWIETVESVEVGTDSAVINPLESPQPTG
jgi:predicted DNA-binding ribbon-helix-helix protein